MFVTFRNFSFSSVSLDLPIFWGIKLTLKLADGLFREKTLMREICSRIHFFTSIILSWKSGLRWYFVSKIVLTYCEIGFCKYSALKLEFQKFFSITRTFFLTVGQNNFGNKIPFLKNEVNQIYGFWTFFLSLPDSKLWN